MNELPVVDTAKCIGCGECVEICPTACLAMAGPLPWLPRPRDCTSCAACELICPTDAIALVTPACDRPSASP
jgi:formate hydrogenlyase subunit 6/NADH:ubiquinone oxidoreductase subunit I